jgi:hypothetical protein
MPRLVSICYCELIEVDTQAMDESMVGRSSELEQAIGKIARNRQESSRRRRAQQGIVLTEILSGEIKVGVVSVKGRDDRNRQTPREMDAKRSASKMTENGVNPAVADGQRFGKRCNRRLAEGYQSIPKRMYLNSASFCVSSVVRMAVGKVANQFSAEHHGPEVTRQTYNLPPRRRMMTASKIKAADVQKRARRIGRPSS